MRPEKGWRHGGDDQAWLEMGVMLPMFYVLLLLFGLAVGILGGLLGIGGGTLVVALVGWLATRRLLAAPPIQVLNSG